MAGDSTSTMCAAFKMRTIPPHSLKDAIDSYLAALTAAQATGDPTGNGDAPEYLAAWDEEMAAGKALIEYQCATPDDIQMKIATIFAHAALRDVALAAPEFTYPLLQSFIPPIDKAIGAYADAEAQAAAISDDDEDKWKAAHNKVWDTASNIIDAPCHTFDQVQRKFIFIRDNRAVADCLTLGSGAVMDPLHSIAGEA